MYSSHRSGYANCGYGYGNHRSGYDSQLSIALHYPNLLLRDLGRDDQGVRRVSGDADPALGKVRKRHTTRCDLGNDRNEHTMRKVPERAISRLGHFALGNVAGPGADVIGCSFAWQWDGMIFDLRFSVQDLLYQRLVLNFKHILHNSGVNAIFDLLANRFLWWANEEVKESLMFDVWSLKSSYPDDYSDRRWSLIFH